MQRSSILLPQSLGTGVLALAPKRYYTTNFDLTENPLSEGGAWVSNGSSWTPLSTASGLCVGNQDNTGGYDDSNSCLRGFAPNHQAWTTIRKNAPSGLNMEVAVTLRWTITSTLTTGYECNIHHNGNYASITRWNGALGSFDEITHITNVTTPQDGDVLSATVIGTNIVSYLNGAVLATADLAAFGGTIWVTGNPGLDLFRNNGGASNTFCVTSFTAVDL